MTASAKSLFREKVAPADTRGCMNWTGCIGGDGYGHVRWERAVASAHRVAFSLSNGFWPTAHVLHECDNPLCCNPAHLRLGTHQENMQDCARKGRNRTPRPGNGTPKLNPADLDQIRSRFQAGETNKSALAREFGVSPPRIRQVVQP